MSETESQTLAELMAAFQGRALAIVGRWAISILATIAVVTAGAASQWFGQLGRIDRLETWKADRAVPIEEYNQFRTALEGRLSRLEAGQEEILRLLKSR